MTDFSSQKLPSEHENKENNSITDPNFSLHFSRVKEGLEFILSHFEEPLFPRKVATAATKNAQKPDGGVLDTQQAMTYYQGSLWEDCRIAAFGLNQQNPNLVFVDIDAKDFPSRRSFTLALTKTLKNIKEKIGGTPSIIWSGRGYHIIQPIACSIALEEIKELVLLEPNTSNKFLQFCERYLSAGKYDGANHPSLKSCQLRIPGSINSRCKEIGLPPEVKVLQKWNGYRPSYRLLLVSFYADLISKNMPTYREIQKQKKQQKEKNPARAYTHVSARVDSTTWWIEKLFQLPIKDYRKRARDLILVPYLIVRRGIEDEDQVTNIVMQWADKCAELRRLDTSRHDFENRTWTRAKQSIQDRIPPMKLSTLQERNLELYEILTGI
ncbi:MAG: hypothetical protein M3275_16650 [Thermoproteota archaeon]|nr:hypothetical protein [Thermoproteota archaeon]